MDASPDDGSTGHDRSGTRPGRRIRHLPALVLVGSLVVMVVVGVFGVRFNPQRGEVARPGPEANPATVVKAYIAAYDARDLDALYAIAPGTRDTTGRFTPMGTFTDLVLRETRYDDGSSLQGPAGSDPARGRVYVPVTMTTHDMDPGDSGFQNGPMVWGFFLERSSESEPWVVVDQGVG